MEIAALAVFSGRAPIHSLKLMPPIRPRVILPIQDKSIVQPNLAPSPAFSPAVAMQNLIGRCLCHQKITWLRDASKWVTFVVEQSRKQRREESRQNGAVFVLPRSTSVTFRAFAVGSPPWRTSCASLGTPSGAGPRPTLPCQAAPGYSSFPRPPAAIVHHAHSPAKIKTHAGHDTRMISLPTLAHTGNRCVHVCGRRGTK